MKKIQGILAAALITWCCYAFRAADKPVLYIVGDSTVKNGSGKGSDELWGWGSFMAGYFDTTRLDVRNHAIGGRSSRTFLTEGRWDRIMTTLHKGDYVIIQFGHNDSSPLDDTARARGTIKGIGNDSVKTYNPIRKMEEVVYTYGYYMRKMIKAAQDKGAQVIVCSPVPRNNFENGKVKRGNNDYGLWASQIAAETGAFFLDLNNKVADAYDRLGSEAVAQFFPKDHTHPNEAGARLNAEQVIAVIQELKQCGLRKYLLSS
jgi:lysophospholipase L1-like esterase